MPIVTVQMAKGRTQEVKRKLVASVTGAVAASLDLPPELVTVLIEEFERENWATGGELHLDKFGPGFGNNKQ